MHASLFLVFLGLQIQTPETFVDSGSDSELIAIVDTLVATSTLQLDGIGAERLKVYTVVYYISFASSFTLWQHVDSTV